MKWRDLLYFSKGERQALTLLLSLIAMAWIAIIGTDFYRSQFQTVPLANTGIKQDSSRIYSNKTPSNFIRKEKESHSNESLPIDKMGDNHIFSLPLDAPDKISTTIVVEIL